MKKSFYRKVGFGIGKNEKEPSDSLQWALNQLDSIPPFTWSGKILSEKEMRKKYGEWVYGDRKILRKKYKNDKNKYREEKNKLRNKTGERFFESNELTIRHHEAIKGDYPVFERLWHFWGNHFAISDKDFLAVFSTGPYQREVIRSNMVNTFEQMVKEVTTSWCMLHHLDNPESVGPQSKNGVEGFRNSINENHARELLELHTISPEAGYSQKDVIQATYIMTGWGRKWDNKRLETGDVTFHQDDHQPNSKVVLGKTYIPKGRRELFDLIHNLVNHPSCKKFIATKLCRHFITDYPTEDMIAPILEAWEKSNGFLPEIHKAVIRTTFEHTSSTRKFQKPETWALQIVRMFDLHWLPKPDQMKYNFKTEPTDPQKRIEWALEELGHLPYRSKQPNGWSDFEEDWISPELIIRRLIFASKMSLKGLVRDENIIKAVIEKNFDEPSKIYKLLDSQKDYKNKLAIICNSSEMLKA